MHMDFEYMIKYIINYRISSVLVNKNLCVGCKHYGKCYKCIRTGCYVKVNDIIYTNCFDFDSTDLY